MHSPSLSTSPSKNFQHAFATELHLEVPLTWDEDQEDRLLLQHIRHLLQPSEAQAMRFSFLEDFCYSDGLRRVRAWGVTFHSDTLPLTRQIAHGAWAKVLEAAAEFRTTGGGPVKVRNKSATATVSRALPCWSPTIHETGHLGRKLTQPPVPLTVPLTGGAE